MFKFVHILANIISVSSQNFFIWFFYYPILIIIIRSNNFYVVFRRFHKSTSWSSYSAQYLQNTNPFESQRRKPVPSSKSSEPAIFLSEGEPEIKEEIKIEPFNENNSQAPHVINDSLEEAEVKREICDEKNGSEYLENNDPLESPPPHLKPSSSIASRPHSNPVIHKTNLEA